jgi:hypothetical protein
VEFQTKQSSVFIMNMLLIALALGMAIFSFIYKHFQHAYFQYSYILWLALALLRVKVYHRYIFLIINNKPVFAVNENYIDDFAKNIRYDWKDIDEVYEYNGYLHIKLYKPAEYLSKIKGALNKTIKTLFYRANNYENAFVINIDMIKVNPDVFLEILYNFSLKAVDGKS